MRGAGHGVFLTASQAIPSGLDWAAVLLAANTAERVADLRRAGVSTIYVWDHPRSWGPDGWRNGVERHVAAVRRYSLAGFVADPENGWSASDRSEAAEFAAVLNGLVGSMEVGVTTFPGSPILDLFKGKIDRRVWGAVQIYNRGSRDARVFSRWLERYRETFPSTIPILATFVPTHGYGSDLSTPAGYASYLDRVPTSYGFATYGVGPAYMAQAISRYRPVTTAPVVGGVLAGLAGMLPGVPMPVVVTLLAIAVVLVLGFSWVALGRPGLK